MIRMKVSPKAARDELSRIDHKTCQRARPARWHTYRDENGKEQAKAQSICWLFCWAQTGMGSRTAAEDAQQAFDRIFDHSYAWLSGKLSLEQARRLRYIPASQNIEQELADIVGAMIRMKVSPKAARDELSRIDHKTCQRARPARWHTYRDENGKEQAKAQSICWLFCWAQTGMGNRTAAEDAQQAFDRIFDHSYAWLSGKLSLEQARRLRYIPASQNIEQELADIVGAS